MSASAANSLANMEDFKSVTYVPINERVAA